jgi:hypothetical protein
MISAMLQRGTMISFMVATEEKHIGPLALPGTINDIIHGFQGAQWNEPSMVATEGGELGDIKKHQKQQYVLACAL